MNCRAKCLSDRLDLTGDSDGIYNKHTGWSRARLSRLDYSTQSLTHPGTVVGPIQSLARTLKRAALVLHPSDPFFDEFAGTNNMRAIPIAQETSKGRFASTNRPG